MVSTLLLLKGMLGTCNLMCSLRELDLGSGASALAPPLICTRYMSLPILCSTALSRLLGSGNQLIYILMGPPAWVVPYPPSPSLNAALLTLVESNGHRTREDNPTASTRVGNMSTNSTGTSTFMPLSVSPGIEMNKGLRVAMSKLVNLDHRACSPKCHPWSPAILN